MITCFRCGNQVNQPQGTRRTICPYCGGFFVQDGEESGPRRTAPQGKPPPASSRQSRRSRPSDPELPTGRGSRGDIRDDQFPRRSSVDSSTSSVRRQVLAEVPPSVWISCLKSDVEQDAVIFVIRLVPLKCPVFAALRRSKAASGNRQFLLEPSWQEFQAKQQRRLGWDTAASSVTETQLFNGLSTTDGDQFDQNCQSAVACVCARHQGVVSSTPDHHPTSQVSPKFVLTPMLVTCPKLSWVWITVISHS